MFFCVDHEPRKADGVARMPKKKSLLNEVVERAASSTPGYRSWFNQLPPDAQSELSVVREAYLSGELRGRQKRSVALAVMDVARERGWRTSGIQGVIAWLDAKRR
jgi:hypothetical protein